MNILFVCASNICRSPYAEYVFRRLVDRDEILKRNITSIRSAAVFNKSFKMPAFAVEALRKEGFTDDEIACHTPAFKWGDFVLFENADMIVGMSKIHRFFTPVKYRKKFVLLSEAAIGKSLSIPDPFLKKTQAEYDEVMEILKTFLELFAKDLSERFAAMEKDELKSSASVPAAPEREI